MSVGLNRGGERMHLPRPAPVVSHLPCQSFDSIKGGHENWGNIIHERKDQHDNHQESENQVYPQSSRNCC